MNQTMTNILRICEAQEGKGIVAELMPAALNKVLKRVKIYKEAHSAPNFSLAWFTNSSYQYSNTLLQY